MLNEVPDDNVIPYSASERSFGAVMCVFFTLIGAVIPLSRSAPLRPAPLVIAAVFLILAVVAPRTLRRPNQAWGLLAKVLHRVMSPVFLAVVYFLVFAPIGWLVRITQADFFEKTIKREAKSYWHSKDRSQRSSMKNQF